MDNAFKKLRIDFPEGWVDISDENPGGPPAFINEQVDDPGVLQISAVEYSGGELPDPSTADLITMAKNVGAKNQFGAVMREESGECNYGIYSYVEFSSKEFPYVAVWYLSDGKNFVFATFICGTIPEAKHIEDVRHILMSIKRKSFFGSLFE